MTQSHQTQQAHSGQRNGSGNGNGDATTGLNFGHYGVRLCGQDSERGTFNQRHAAIYDQHTGERFAATLCLRVHRSLSYPYVCPSTASKIATQQVNPLLGSSLRCLEHFRFDMLCGNRHTALNAVKPGSQNYLEVCNTPLSEAASAAFEYGFSLGSRVGVSLPDQQLRLLCTTSALPSHASVSQLDDL